MKRNRTEGDWVVGGCARFVYGYNCSGLPAGGKDMRRPVAVGEKMWLARGGRYKSNLVGYKGNIKKD